MASLAGLDGKNCGQWCCIMLKQPVDDSVVYAGSCAAQDSPPCVKHHHAFSKVRLAG